MVVWTRVKRSAEVKAVVPPPPLRAREGWGSQQLEARFHAVGDGRRGKGLNKSETVIFEPRPEVAGGLGLGLFRAGDHLGQPPPTVEIDRERPWFPTEREELERQAEAILQAHDFPTEIAFPPAVLWAWSGNDLHWASNPTPHKGAAMAADDATSRGWSLENWEDFGRSAEARRLWPARSAFDWAEHVHRYRRARLWAETLIRARDDWAHGALRQAWEAGFELGIYLAHYQLEGKYGEEKGRNAETKTKWHGPFLDLCISIRAGHPSISQSKLVDKATTEWKGSRLPRRETLQKTISKWERAGSLARSSGNRTGVAKQDSGLG